MSLSHALLALAKERPRYPYAMKQAFEEVFGEFWPLNYGQVHQSLEASTRKGLLTKSPDPTDASRSVYAITDAGEAELEAWYRDFSKVRVRALRDEIFLRLYLQGRDGPNERFTQLLDEYRLEYTKYLRNLTQERAVQDRAPLGEHLPVERLLLEAAIEHAEADARWLDRVALAIDGEIDFAAEARDRVHGTELPGGEAPSASEAS